MPSMERLGAWAFRQRSWLPVPLALILVFVRWWEADTPAVFVSGVAVVGAGLLVRLWGVRHIGTISRTRANRQGPLITTGPYALVRNPLYVGNWLLWTGFVLMSGLLWMLPIAWIVFAIEYGSIAAWEEGRLRDHYGADYEAYARVVPRWCPGFRSQGKQVGAAPSYVWRDVAFSERGTLLAAGAMTILLVLKRLV